MSPMSNIDFASLLCSRLCHDLVSPIGALTNGVELLADETDPAMRAQCMDLLADSARQSANRLKFFRLAFGAGGGYGMEVDVREIKAAIEGLFSPDKVKLEWLVPAATLPKSAVKLLLNLALLAGESLLRGGTLSLAAESAGGQIEIGVKADGPRTLLSEDLRLALQGQLPAAQIDARAAPAALVAELVRSNNGQLQLAPAEAGAPVVIAVRISA
jgi:histidine phosphotransferase ChpT